MGRCNGYRVVRVQQAGGVTVSREWMVCSKIWDVKAVEWVVCSSMWDVAVSTKWVGAARCGTLRSEWSGWCAARCGTLQTVRSGVVCSEMWDVTVRLDWVECKKI